MAEIRIDLDDVIGEVDRRIFGGFIEHEGRSIYGGLLQPGSPLADGEGVRTDTLAALTDLQLPVLRWPGGNFVSAYHWRDGIGPTHQRPARLDPAWSAVEPNTFGTDEFMAYCQRLGTEPYLCFNMGTGTLQEAMDWLEYCNGTRETALVQERARNGHPEPYAVKYWGLGNEMWGDWQVGHCTAEEYVAEAKRWALALRRVDPTIELVACGKDGWSEWDRTVIDGLVRYVDWHSVHLYTGSDDYWSNVLGPHQAERALRSAGALIDRARYLQGVTHPVHVTYDEWNTWFATREDRRPDKVVEERHTMADAVAVATYLNIFVRHCQTVKMANLAQMINVLAPIVTSDEGLLRQAIYPALQAASAHTQELALRARVISELVSHERTHTDRVQHDVSDLGPFTELDVAVTRDRHCSRVLISIVNRSPQAPVPVEVDLGGAHIASAKVRTISAADPLSTNSWQDPDAVGLHETELDGSGPRLSHKLPACSVTQLDLQLRP